MLKLKLMDKNIFKILHLNMLFIWNNDNSLDYVRIQILRAINSQSATEGDLIIKQRNRTNATDVDLVPRLENLFHVQLNFLNAHKH